MTPPTDLLPGAPPPPWPKPPACVPHDRLDEVPQGARLCVAGLVLVRQRPGTAKGVIFITLEDETGVCNVIVWRKIYEAFRRAVIAGRLLRVTGRMQREGAVTHVIAERIEDLSALLDSLLTMEGQGADGAAPPQAAQDAGGRVSRPGESR